MAKIYSMSEIPVGMDFWETATFWKSHELTEELLQDPRMRETKTIVWKARKLSQNDRYANVNYATDSWSPCFFDFDDAEEFLKENGVDKSRCRYVHDGDRISITVYPEPVDQMVV